MHWGYRVWNCILYGSMINDESRSKQKMLVVLLEFIHEKTHTKKKDKADAIRELGLPLVSFSSYPFSFFFFWWGDVRRLLRFLLMLFFLLFM